MMVSCAQQPVPEMISFWLCFDVSRLVCVMAYSAEESVWCVLTDLSAAEFIAVHIVAVVIIMRVGPGFTIWAALPVANDIRLIG